jgi:cytochrome oxidase Cu insertion factor (SCO1/SenC/PrrC family)
LVGVLVLASTGLATAATAATDPPEPAPTFRIGAIPDVGVVDHNGKALNFYTDLVRGRTVAIQFIFTSCSTICKPLSAIFSELQREFADQPEVQLISISVDPGNDTSERLKSHATKFSAGPQWSLVTGKSSDIEQLLRALGAWTANRADHSGLLLIGNDRSGKWTRANGLAAPDSIADVLRSVM